jgi:TonB family protein
LPVEVVNDLTRLRSLLERMIAQAREIAAEHKAYDSLSLLEDVLGVRLSLAVDSDDQTKWSGEYASARQTQAAAPTQIASLAGISALPPSKAPLNKIASPSPYAVRRTPETDAAPRAVTGSEQQHGASQTQTSSTPLNETKTPAAAETSTPALPAPLNARATKRVLPRYPQLARQSGTVGSVRVYVVIDEHGEVLEIARSEGPLLLRRAAEEAARQWRFTPAPDTETPTRVTGYLDFNFTL